MYRTDYSSPVGKYTLVSSETHLLGIWKQGQKYFCENICDAVEMPEQPVLVKAAEWLERYFAGEKPEISEVPLKPAGSEFRQSVWQLLCEIPYGRVTTYGELARVLAGQRGLEKMSAQAVGGAVGHNPVSIIIPCHRVIGAGGKLTGYAGGLDTKIKLLEHEKADMSEIYGFKRLP